MKSDIIYVDNHGNGHDNAISATENTAKYRGLTEKETYRLTVCAEEMMSLASSVTGELKASFWIESEGKQFDLHLSTQTVMDREKRNNLMAAATSGKNEAANTFLGRILDAFQAAMLSDPDNSIPDEAMGDMANRAIEIPEWDGYEKSVLHSVADQVRIGIRGRTVDMVVSKCFD